MSDKPSKMNGAAEQVLGSAKSVVGSVTGNETIKQSGDEQSAKGDAEYKLKQNQQKAEATKDNVEGAAREHIGGLFSDDQKAKGKAEQTKADAKEEASKV